MVASDKVTAIGQPHTHGRGQRIAAYAREKKIKSIPRTRKEKCQTAGQRQHLCAWRELKALHACQFEWGLEPVSFGFSGRHRAARLTSLTASCQNCQTNGPNCLQRCCRDPPRHPSEHQKSTQSFT
jgi:hypothetical protein